MAEADLVAYKAELLSIQMTAEAFKTANALRDSQGYAQAYGEESFDELSDKALEIAKALRRESVPPEPTADPWRDLTDEEARQVAIHSRDLGFLCGFGGAVKVWDAIRKVRGGGQ